MTKREFIGKEMTKEISIEEFRESGALWYANQQLHLMGMCIVYDPDTNTLKPALCKFRGFSEDSVSRGYKRVNEYLLNNIVALRDECYDSEEDNPKTATFKNIKKAEYVIVGVDLGEVKDS
jgi:hypothetical protein